MMAIFDEFSMLIQIKEKLKKANENTYSIQYKYNNTKNIFFSLAPPPFAGDLQYRFFSNNV